MSAQPAATAAPRTTAPGLPAWVLIGAVLGIAAGLLLGERMAALETVGVAYARLLAPASDQADAPARIGRVIVAPESRGRALGRRLMEDALTACAAHWPDAGVQLAAQAHLRDFYVSLGFEAISDVYDDDGIPHVDMRLLH